jgi:hypothetical protein
MKIKDGKSYEYFDTIKMWLKILPLATVKL